MGLNPTKFLVVPKFLAMLFAVPCVTVRVMLIMWILGGAFAGVVLVGVDPMVYYNQTASALTRWT